ncbi:hypothetical protein D3C85_1772990 [compost metagenome]
MQGDQAGPVRASLEQRQEPDFRLRTGVGEHQAAGAGFELGHDRRQHFQANVPGPRKALEGRRQQRVDLQSLGRLPLNVDTTALWD